MPLVNFSNLDFDQIKTSIQDYLKANSNFTDYDYEGSNLSTIIDLLAYNTYITSYNANMVTNEVFIDSATLRENVVSLARNIGYVPRSRKAAKATVSFSVDASNTTATTLTLRAGLVLTTSSRFGNTNFTFSIPSDITVPVDSTGTAYFNDIDVYEGTFVQQSFTVSSRTPDQRFTLTNAGIDTALLNVIVKESATSSVQRKYRQSDSLFDVTSSSPVYFLQEVSDERYELLFGDGVFGIKPEEPNVIQVNYIITNGEDGNNLSSFSFSGSLVDNNGSAVTNGISVVTTGQSSYGGKAIESVNSVKKYATQIYASQNRAVTAKDYQIRALSMPTKFGSIAKAYATADGTLDNNSPSSILASPKALQEFTDLVMSFVEKPDEEEPNKESVQEEIKKYLLGKTSNDNEKNNPFAINLYLLGYDSDKKLSTLNRAIKENLKTYLSEYKILTDGININDGFIINIGVEFEIITFKNYKN